MTDWECPSCGNQNFGNRLQCNLRKCGKPRPGLPASPAVMGNGLPGGFMPVYQQSQMQMKGGSKGVIGEGNWTCSSCGNENYQNRTVCNMKKCGLPRPPSDWTCPGCGNNNFA